MENNDKAVVIRDQYYNREVWGQMKDMSQVLIISKALPSYIANAAQAMVVMQSGYEMGMKPLESFNSLYIVNGAVNVWGKAIIRRLREHGYQIEYKDTKDACTATVTKDKEKYTETYTFAEAEESGYTKGKDGLKVGWKAGINRRLKLRYGVISLIVKTYIPDVLGSAVDIVEVAEDYEPIQEQKTDEKSTTKSDKESVGRRSLGEFINKEAEKSEEAVEGEVVVEETKTEEPVDTKDDSKSEEVDTNQPTYDMAKVRRRYYAVAKEFGWDSETAKEKIKAKFKVESFNDLTPQQILDATEKMEKKLEEKK